MDAQPTDPLAPSARALHQQRELRQHAQGVDPLIPSVQVRREFGISRTTLWRWERDGILPRAHRIRNQRYFPRSALDALRAAAAKPGGVDVEGAKAA